MRLFEESEIRLLKALEGPLPLVERPFAELAQRIGISEEQLLERVRAWVADGTIRRFGARLNHRHMGYGANGMAVWQAPGDQVEKAAEFIVGLPEVSHCYLRAPVPGWNYNLFAMIHGAREEDVLAVARRIAESTGLDCYEVLFSRREFKKSAPKFFAGQTPVLGE